MSTVTNNIILISIENVQDDTVNSTKKLQINSQKWQKHSF